MTEVQMKEDSDILLSGEEQGRAVLCNDTALFECLFKSQTIK